MDEREERLLVTSRWALRRGGWVTRGGRRRVFIIFNVIRRRSGE